MRAQRRQEWMRSAERTVAAHGGHTALAVLAAVLAGLASWALLIGVALVLRALPSRAASIWERHRVQFALDAVASDAIRHDFGCRP